MRRGTTRRPARTASPDPRPRPAPNYADWPLAAHRVWKADGPAYGVCCFDSTHSILYAVPSLAEALAIAPSMQELLRPALVPSQVFQDPELVLCQISLPIRPSQQILSCAAWRGWFREYHSRTAVSLLDHGSVTVYGYTAVGKVGAEKAFYSCSSRAAVQVDQCTRSTARSKVRMLLHRAA